MTRDDIISMVKEASGGRQPDGWGVMLDHEQLERFVELVTATEREACAALCFQMWNEWLVSKDRQLDGFNRPDAEDCAHAIRARGQG